MRVLKSRLRLRTKKVRALALDAIEKLVASRAADLAPTIKQLQAAGNTAARIGCWSEFDGYHDSTRWQLGSDAGAPAVGSDLRCDEVRAGMSE
jgi:hypothetical protein